MPCSRDTGVVTTTTTKIERSGPAIRHALTQHAPAEAHRFEVEFQQALATAGQTFDLHPVETLLDRWWGIAAVRANPLTDDERHLVAQARAGDTSGWLTRDQDGHWTAE
jgi:hypothetical protein